MNKKIDRTLIWFENEFGRLQELSDSFYGLSTLLNRLLNEDYKGKKMKFINIFLATSEKYFRVPAIPINYTHYYGGHLNTYGDFDSVEFNKLDYLEKNIYVWDRVYENLSRASKSIKNTELLEASEYAYRKGLELNVNPDYAMVEADIVISGQVLKASVFVNFKKDGMYSKFIVAKGSEVIFEKEIDSARNGIEFFLDIYKSIELDGNNILVKGRKDVDYLPLRIPLEEITSK